MSLRRDASWCSLALVALTWVVFPVSVVAQPARVAWDTAGRLEPLPADALAQKRVLVLYAFEANLPVFEKTNNGILPVFEAAGYPLANQFYEYLDLRRNPGAAHRQQLADLLRLRYHDQAIDMLVTVYPEALRFALTEGRALAPSAPILALYLPQGFQPPPTARRIIPQSLHETYDPAGTLDSALRLLPGTRQVDVVFGTHENDQQLEARARHDFQPWAGRLAFRYLSALPLEAMLTTLAAAPPGTIVIFGGLTTDVTGGNYTSREVAQRLSRASTAPVFGLNDVQLGYGIVGGSLVSFERTGAAAARLVLEFLATGHPPPGLSLNVPPVPMFDGRQLTRWHLPLNALTPGSVVINREYTFWEQYYWHILTALAMIVALTLTVLVLLVERKTRHAAEAERQLLAAVVESSDEATLSLDLDGRITSWNPRAAELFGYPAAEAKGREIWLLVPPAGQAEARQIFDRVKAGASLAELETVRCTKDGTEVPVVVVAAPLRDAGGRVVGVVTNYHDLRERKRAARETERLRHELTHLGRTALLGELTASLAHELNQPLTAIVANADVGRQMLRESAPALGEVGEILTDVMADAERAGEVIRRLRSLLKKDVSRFTSLDLNAVIREVVALTRTDALIRHHPIQLELAASLPPLQGDRIQLQQVLLNLVMNGMEAMEHQPWAERRLLVQTVTEGNTVQVAVRDNGPGIPADHLTTIFDSFFTTKDKGMGIGLAISRSIIEAHGGKLWAENNPGGGATFWFTLPGEAGTRE